MGPHTFPEAEVESVSSKCWQEKIMSDAQVVFFQARINKKLFEQTRSLRNQIAYYGLYMELLPVLTESNERLDQNGAVLNQVIEEMQDRLALGRAAWMREVEYLTEKFAALTLGDVQDRSVVMRD